MPNILLSMHYSSAKIVEKVNIHYIKYVVITHVIKISFIKSALILIL